MFSYTPKVRHEITTQNKRRRATLGFFVKKNDRIHALTAEHPLWYNKTYSRPGSSALGRRPRHHQLLGFKLKVHAAKWSEFGKIAEVGSLIGSKVLSYSDSAIIDLETDYRCHPPSSILNALRPFSIDKTSLKFDTKPLSKEEALVDQMWVAKAGAVSGVTVGRIDKLKSNAIRVEAGVHVPEMIIPDYISITGADGKFSKPGDSGASVWALKGSTVRPLAIICATSPGMTAVAIPITRILKLHQAEVTI